MRAMPRSAQENTVFVIDDDDIIRLSCEQILKKSGYTVETFGKGHEGIERLKEVRPPLLVVDIKMPELDGFEIIKLVRKIDPDIVIVVITGYATIETAIDAMKAGAYDFLPKPFTPSELRLIIERGVERWRLAKETQLLRKQKEDVERKFVTLVSHQLKGPLGAVKQYLDVLLYTNNQLPAEAVEWISRSQARISEMLSLIQDWLMLAKLDRGALCDRTVSSDMSKVVESVLHEYQHLPSAANVQLTTEIGTELEEVCGDPVSLNMLLSNLVNNAIKYNRPGGSVKIKLSRSESRVVLQVSDTGIGIPASFRSHLFEEFYRAKTPETQNVPGTGLGLVICKRIVSELGGSIEVDSKEGEYTTFTVALPIAEKGNSSDTEAAGK
jgi:two-component system, sensor histidine kinase and response regulator